MSDMSFKAIEHFCCSVGQYRIFIVSIFSMDVHGWSNTIKAEVKSCNVH